MFYQPKQLYILTVFFQYSFPRDDMFFFQRGESSSPGQNQAGTLQDLTVRDGDGNIVIPLPVEKV